MKKSEMISKLSEFLFEEKDMSTLRNEEIAVFLLEMLETEGMSPPSYLDKGDPNHKLTNNVDENNYCCSFHFDHPSGISKHEWEPEDEK